MTTQYWLVKSEPEAYGWDDLLRDRKTDWTGVRNYAARNNLSAMRCGDQVLFYESVTTKAIVGRATVSRTAFPDATADEPGWVAVELTADAALSKPVTLAALKESPTLAKMSLVRISRLSVHPVTAAEFKQVLKLGGA